jgi:hypothetical protein
MAKGAEPNFVVFSTDSEERLRERTLLLEDFDRLLRLLVAGEGERRRTRSTSTSSRARATCVASATWAQAWQASYARQPKDRSLRQRGGFGPAERRPVPRICPPLHAAERPHVAPGLVRRRLRRIFLHCQIHEAEHRHRQLFPGPDRLARGCEWLPWERVLGGTSAGLTPVGISMFYAQSWLLTHYFYSNAERQAAHRRYLAAVAKDGPVRAMEAPPPQHASLHQGTQQLHRGGRINYRRCSGRPHSLSRCG